MDPQPPTSRDNDDVGVDEKQNKNRKSGPQILPQHEVQIQISLKEEPL